MSMAVAPEAVSLPLFVNAVAPVNASVPHFASFTSELPSSKSSTIHSALAPHKAELDVKDLVTVLPVLRFWSLATPALDEEDVTVATMTLPAARLKPEKS